MRIAVVGSGIAGLGAAWLLRRQYAVTLYERNGYVGGHTHTLEVPTAAGATPVDTGFMVFNHRNYPLLTGLFRHLNIATQKTDMSFGVSIGEGRVEYAGSNLATLMAQPRNWISATHYRMLADILRFNRETTAALAAGTLPDTTLGAFLDARRYRRPFRDSYLVPMAAAIWSSPAREILDFPLPTFVRFCHNHGLLAIDDRPQWRTVQGGGRVYVQRIVEQLADVRLGCPVQQVRRRGGGVEIDSPGRPGERFDGVVLACHSDQALALLADPSADERRLLGEVRYQPNRVVLHTDAALLPRRQRAWAAWNYLAADDPEGCRPVSVSYLINRLQPLPFRKPVIVTLNPAIEPDPRAVIDEFEYSHPLLDARAVGAQDAIARRQGRHATWYAGAWLGYGFHEDGLRSAHAAAASIAEYAARRGQSVAAAA